ncbi:D-2-hydroxyacid dehydrogenase [Sedimentimonas flavescens]|uniref:D-2-hydroxyacid dehydrogenase n=1 Tax=Sedimentimonas flavescens TaxID=2851012 RepID=UPI001C4A5A0A|nr:D-2-hydroxyacid dehydrogenase [Sedimentimonas flavescens]MBW0159642.1 D-2-hydroxyacid dehydrogenase [Sedimentimonas flavescens]
MKQIVFLDRATIAPQIALPRPAFAHDWVEYERTAANQTSERLRNARIAITNKVRMGAAELAAAPYLELIAVAATGYDCVDLTACTARGVAVCNIRGYSVNTVPEHVMALLLGLRRGIVSYAEAVRQGEWQRSGQFCFFKTPIHDLSGATLGIVGKGGIGQRVAALGKAFGMEVIYAARPGTDATDGRVPFEEFCERVDVISLHCPLTPETRGIIGDAAFAHMKRRPIVINTARGGLIDLPALERALSNGVISGAGIDVADREPPPPDDILMTLANDPRVIVTPHIAWASDEAQTALSNQLITVIEAFEAGQPINLLTPKDE